MKENLLGDHILPGRDQYLGEEDERKHNLLSQCAYQQGPTYSRYQPLNLIMESQNDTFQIDNGKNFVKGSTGDSDLSTTTSIYHQTCSVLQDMKTEDSDDGDDLLDSYYLDSPENHGIETDMRTDMQTIKNEPCALDYRVQRQNSEPVLMSDGSYQNFNQNPFFYDSGGNSVLNDSFYI